LVTFSAGPAPGNPKIYGPFEHEGPAFLDARQGRLQADGVIDLHTRS